MVCLHFSVPRNAATNNMAKCLLLIVTMTKTMCTLLRLCNDIAIETIPSGGYRFAVISLLQLQLARDIHTTRTVACMWPTRKTIVHTPCTIYKTRERAQRAQQLVYCSTSMLRLTFYTSHYLCNSLRDLCPFRPSLVHTAECVLCAVTAFRRSFVVFNSANKRNKRVGKSKR